MMARMLGSATWTALSLWIGCDENIDSNDCSSLSTLLQSISIIIISQATSIVESYPSHSASFNYLNVMFRLVYENAFKHYHIHNWWRRQFQVTYTCQLTAAMLLYQTINMDSVCQTISWSILSQLHAPPFILLCPWKSGLHVSIENWVRYLSHSASPFQPWRLTNFK